MDYVFQIVLPALMTGKTLWTHFWPIIKNHCPLCNPFFKNFHNKYPLNLHNFSSHHLTLSLHLSSTKMCFHCWSVLWKFRIVWIINKNGVTLQRSIIYLDGTLVYLGVRLTFKVFLPIQCNVDIEMKVEGMLREIKGVWSSANRSW